MTPWAETLETDASGEVPPLMTAILRDLLMTWSHFNGRFNGQSRMIEMIHEN